jgi:eukaryotic-like serine/threonine-protein kinase
VLKKKPQLAMGRQFLHNCHKNRALALDELRRHAEAIKDWDRAIELFDGKEPSIRLQRAVSLARAGEHARATAEADALADSKDVTIATLYDAACIHALSSAAARQDAKQADRYAARAVALLLRAIQKGWNDAEHIGKDSDLDPLRQRDDFQKLIRDLEEKVRPRPEPVPPPKEEKN